jgi:phosphoglycolate phosphatase
MKPNPYLLEQAALALETSPSRCAHIGDQITDVQAARAIGAPSIGLANKPDNADDLTAAGADAVIVTIDELTEAIRTR